MKYQIDKKDIRIDIRELKQRLGGADISIAHDALEEVKKVMNPMYVIKNTMVKHFEEGVDLGFGYIDSRNLLRNLRDCKEAYVICVTLGSEVDVLLRKSSLKSPSFQFLIDAAASAAVEACVDYIESKINKKIMPRFAPGYGDFSIAYQPDLLEYLDTGKIGVGLTESNLMIPTKSVSCIMGVLDEDN